jgi:hypothetical protein
LLLLMAIALSAAVALRIVPQFAPVVGDWAESYHPNASDELFIRYDGAWAEDDIHGSAVSAGGKIHW